MNVLLTLFFVFLVTYAEKDLEIEVKDEVTDITEKPSVSTTTHGTMIVKKRGDPKESITENKRAIEDRHDNNEEVKKELDKAVKSLKTEEKQLESEGVISNVQKSLEACSSVDCNNRGTCLGTKKTYFCACNLGYSGSSCEDTVCDSSRDCNGRGLCFGTTSTLTCLCNLGYTGKRCETPI